MQQSGAYFHAKQVWLAVVGGGEGVGGVSLHESRGAVSVLSSIQFNIFNRLSTFT